MRQKALKLCLVGLTILLVGTACVRVDSEYRLNSTGHIVSMQDKYVLDDISILSLIDVPEEALEEYAFFWFLTKAMDGFDRNEVVRLETYIDLQEIRDAGLDLEAAGFWEEFSIVRDHGLDPETGHVFIEYLLDLPEIPDETRGTLNLRDELAELLDPMFLSMLGEEMQLPLSYQIVTRMPGKIVSSSQGQTMWGQPDVHVFDVDFLAVLEGPQLIRIVADPEQRVLPFDTVDVKPHQAMQKDVWESGRFWLTGQVAAQEITFREGEHFSEIAGQIVNSGDQSYRWVSLGLSLFDAEGRFIDHHSLMIQNVPAGAERGFHKRLLHGDLTNVAFYRLEWSMGF